MEENERPSPMDGGDASPPGEKPCEPQTPPEMTLVEVEERVTVELVEVAGPDGSAGPDDLDDLDDLNTPIRRDELDGSDELGEAAEPGAEQVLAHANASSVAVDTVADELLGGEPPHSMASDSVEEPSAHDSPAVEDATAGEELPALPARPSEELVAEDEQLGVVTGLASKFVSEPESAVDEEAEDRADDRGDVAEVADEGASAAVERDDSLALSSPQLQPTYAPPELVGQAEPDESPEVASEITTSAWADVDDPDTTIVAAKPGAAPDAAPAPEAFSPAADASMVSLVEPVSSDMLDGAARGEGEAASQAEDATPRQDAGQDAGVAAEERADATDVAASRAATSEAVPNAPTAEVEPDGPVNDAGDRERVEPGAPGDTVHLAVAEAAMLDDLNGPVATVEPGEPGVIAGASERPGHTEDIESATIGEVVESNPDIAVDDSTAAASAGEMTADAEKEPAPAGIVAVGAGEAEASAAVEAANELDTESAAELVALPAPDQALPAIGDERSAPTVGVEADADGADSAAASVSDAPTAVVMAAIRLPAEPPAAPDGAAALADEWDAPETLDGSAAGELTAEDEAFLAAIAALPDQRVADDTPATADEPTGEATVVVIPVPRPMPRAQAAPRRSRARQRRKSRPLVTFVEILLVLLVAFGATYAILDARARYTDAKLLAHAGLQRIEDVQTLFSGPDKFSDALKAGTLTQVQHDLAAAQGDFERLRGVLQAGTFAVAAHTPFISGPLGAAIQLAAAADEACQGGLLAVKGMELVAPIIAGGLFSSSGTTSGASGLTTATITELSAALDGALQHLDIAVNDVRQADLSALPTSLVSAQQRRALQQIIALWPTVRPLAAQVDAFLAGAPALLGLKSPASYLIELMDRTELRPGGGFIGNYAVMTVSQGKVQPFTISDTYLLDQPYLSAHGGHSQAPTSFSWWPWTSYYGLRDSNFSADFPTSAQQGMQELVKEGGPPTQGVIALSVPAIARVIGVVGSIPMPQYNQTVTAQNLESLIHYYQEAVGHDPLTGLPRSDLLSSSRKRFTALLARALMDKLHGLSSAQLLALGKGVLTSLRLKEIQVYVSVPQVESLLTQQGLDGGVTRGPGDGVTIVDANATANKANQFITTVYHDQVMLDAHGTATHQLTITYQFNAANTTLLYGPDLYKTYLRVYVPPGAQLTHLDGLNNLLGDDQINHSDLAWRQMWGGYLIVYNHAPYVLHLTWSVPHAATYTSATGVWSYRLDEQHQSGANQMLNLSITIAGQSHPAIQYNGPLDEDRSFTTSYHAG